MNLSYAILLCFAFLVIDFAGLSSGTCSSDFTDVASCTILSDIVFEGHPVTPVSQSVPRNVTFQVKKLHKGALRQNDKKAFHPVSVGIFGERENTSQCISGPVIPKTKYLVFIKGSNSTSAHGESYRITCSLPVLANKKNSKEASSSACAKCGQKPTVQLSPANEVKVAVGTKAQVSCNHKGNPPPKITWTKNGTPLISSSRIQLKPAKRSSKLIIKKLALDDQGYYECQAVNVLGSSPKIGVRLTAIIRPTTPRPSHKTLCPDQRMCFNNGTCYELTQLGRKFCICPPQFRGHRCQEKNAPADRMSTIMTRDFLFVVVVGASVAGIVLLSAALVALCASLRKQRKVRKLAHQDPNFISRHPNDLAEDDIARACHVNRQDFSMQTEYSPSANEASPAGKRLPGPAPLPNGKLSAFGAGSANVAPNDPGSPHVSSSSSGTSPSESDYFFGHQPNVGSSRRATPQSNAKATALSGKDKPMSRKSKAAPLIEMKHMEITRTSPHMLQKTTKV